MFAYCNNNPIGNADSEGGRPYNVKMTDGGGKHSTNGRIIYCSEKAKELSSHIINHYVSITTPQMGQKSVSVSYNGKTNCTGDALSLKTASSYVGALSTIGGFVAYLNKAESWSQRLSDASTCIGAAALVINGLAAFFEKMSPTERAPEGVYDSFSITITGNYATSFPYEGSTVTHYNVELVVLQTIDDKDVHTYLVSYASQEIITYYGIR